MSTLTVQTRLEREKKQWPIIPVMRQFACDTETPVSAYLKLRAGGDPMMVAPCALLESVEGGSRWGRYSIIALDAMLEVEGDARKVEVRRRMRAGGPDGETATEATGEDRAAVQTIRRILDDYRMPPLSEGPRFLGGLVGYLGWGASRLFEAVPASGVALVDIPDLYFFAPRKIVAFDNLLNRISVVVLVETAGGRAAVRAAEAEIEEVIACMREPLPAGLAYPSDGGASAPVVDRASSPQLVPLIPRGQFEGMVGSAKAAVLAGEAIQIVLSQPLLAPTRVEPFAAYRVLRGLNPSPYMFHIDTGKCSLVGASPEVMVRVEGGTALLRPIAGTRPRGSDVAHDEALEAELVTDPKERAEHLMLLDLARNDLGRVASPGGVRVTEPFVVERFSHVMHLVSTVSAELAPGVDCLDVLRATFPAGTVSGAPKVRAMELIAQLEPYRRGAYAGAVGYLGFQGSMDTCITIRTMVFQGDRVVIQAGAGVVADSDPGREYEETLHKARVLQQCLSLATCNEKEEPCC